MYYRRYAHVASAPHTWTSNFFFFVSSLMRFERSRFFQRTNESGWSRWSVLYKYQRRRTTDAVIPHHYHQQLYVFGVVNLMAGSLRCVYFIVQTCPQVLLAVTSMGIIYLSLSLSHPLFPLLSLPSPLPLPGESGLLVVSENKSFMITASTAVEKDAWLQAIRLCMIDLSTNVESREKLCSSQVRRLKQTQNITVGCTASQVGKGWYEYIYSIYHFKISKYWYLNVYI